MAGFNPKRLAEMRIVRGLTLEQLAIALDVTKQMVSKYEHGSSIPPSDSINTIVDMLNVPRKYLFMGSISLADESSTVFLRAPTSTKKNSREYARIVSHWGYEILCGIDSYPQKHPIFLIDDSLSIPEKAMELRRQWGLGSQPIENMIALLEERGFNIFTIDSPDLRTEAYSQIINGMPIVVLNKKFGTAVRQRFSLAHELGHMVLHGNLVGWEFDLKNKDIEREADLFAEYFLMPIGGFEHSFVSPKMEHIIPLKKEWGVSIGSMIFHCERTGLINAERKDYLQRQVNVRGWKKFEPLDNEIPYEAPVKVGALLNSQIIDQDTFDSFFDKVPSPTDEIEYQCSLPAGTLTDFYNTMMENQRTTQSEKMRFEQLSFFDIGGDNYA